MQELIQQVKQSKVIVIIRGIEQSQAVPLFEALEAGGIRFAEVTLNTPGALQIIHEMRGRYEGRMSVGAGTVLNARMAEEAVQAGAQFLISPNVNEGMIRVALSRSVLPLPGAMTPTEIVQAVEWGAPLVKLFPCSSLGPGYVKELRGPLGHVDMLAVGGITKDNAASYMEAGAVGVGVGGSVVSLRDIQEGNYAAITAYAKELNAAVGV
ncbi:bifunctional 4-hydroxy-2-oxoglutarate aldolase/2-dehydro-3-deoxy-phosphogluconate aldolase [Paenibacillus sedimenti]|uniref:Bifunctional 4-hydroxy-2-oxoglutarate aldolase/2-dehydro-3-deoxy-phosphogluconate aldolase n=1 Tax=Paenibacillus sedimenti TaxID=2770274 RepID=A0A926KT72_9BACL|nr:bifunctional 4-hydroxy-2-oxoglutarate aldolase/2-dehydro-3-deoxy-phosphogluconate aldolase [Paenibacillus sedimenti]MBD0382476.1 bifunctional 4-hydroxy-2-oxoglutarate aldolase/2-dehydro-3-deoxy-phosphogluconate aldolase [Paenibacillus sedimenti]